MLKFGILPEVRSVDRVRRLGRSLGRLWVCKDWGSGFLPNLVDQRSRESRHVKMAGCLMLRERLHSWLLKRSFHKMGRFLRNHAVCSYFSRKLYCEILHFYSFQKPEGLIRLLCAFALKPGETPEQGRARLYRRIWAILWVSWTVSRRFQSSGYFFSGSLT